jgi:hypothetical protein
VSEHWAFSELHACSILGGAFYDASQKGHKFDGSETQKKVIDESRINLITVSTVKSALLRYAKKRRNSGG